MTLASRLLRRFGRDRRGVSAVEFALVAPMFVVVMVGTVDVGLATMARFRLDAAVSAAAELAVLNAAAVMTSNAASLASTLATVTSNTNGTSWANASVTVNAGPVATMTGGVPGSASAGGDQNSCHCPTRSGTGVSWGGAVACGSACTGGGYAGAFVLIIGTRSYTPMFSSFGYGGLMTATSVVETQ